jgi:hypothetical protein
MLDQLGNLRIASGELGNPRVAMEREAIALLEKAGGGAKDAGVKLCIELHGHQLIYNVPTLLKLRKEIGESRSIFSSAP